MSNELSERCRRLLLELGLATAFDIVESRPLTGGVASDIALVDVNGEQYCAKFALSKLRVEADWYAPVKRNAAEYAWLQVAAKIAPESAVTLYGQSQVLNGFVMEYLHDDSCYLWKDALLAQAGDHGEAKKLGKLLGTIHAASTRKGFNHYHFQNSEDFYALRIEPYLLHTAAIHDDIAAILHQLASTLNTANQVLIHGDVSPKNIVFREARPVLLDAECATMGDPSFDVAFCMNHLILKAIHLSQMTERYLQNALALWHSYSEFVTWESRANLEHRVGKLLPALMLARVDGKSPVDYLNQSQRQRVRIIGRQFVKNPTESLQSLIAQMQIKLKEATS